MNMLKTIEGVSVPLDILGDAACPLLPWLMNHTWRMPVLHHRSDILTISTIEQDWWSLVVEKHFWTFKVHIGRRQLKRNG